MDFEPVEPYNQYLACPQVVTARPQSHHGGHHHFAFNGWELTDR